MKLKHLVRLRRISQAAFLIFFLFLLVESRLPQNIYLETALAPEQDLRLGRPVTFFFQLDPLIGLSSLLSGHRPISGLGWGLAILLLTLFLGRIFCSFICPFGTLHHAVGSARPALRGSRQVQCNQKTAGQRIKYFLLTALIVSALLGLNFTGLLDPIALLFRSIALAVIPGLGAGARSIFNALGGSRSVLLSRTGYGAEEFFAPVFGYHIQAYQTAWFIGLLFLVILFLNRIRPRFWCRVLCPLGALLGLCARFSILKLKKYPEKCTQCNLCLKHCQGAASPRPDQTWETAECHMCFNCEHVCPEEALAFGFAPRPKLNPRPDIGKRALLGGLAAGFSFPLLGRLDGRIDKAPDPRLIRPPGSLAEQQFLTLCQRCGLCMKVCPTNAINPTLAEAGMGGFWTPHLIMTRGYCEYTCTLCGSVCPTGAIEPITAREKIARPVKIGSAYLDRGRCLPWSGNAPCIVCQEHCPTSPKAIYLKTDFVLRSDGKNMQVQLPYVDLKRCVGCGICENKCPVRSLPAIRTVSAGESRSSSNQILI